MVADRSDSRTAPADACWSLTPCDGTIDSLDPPASPTAGKGTGGDCTAGGSDGAGIPAEATPYTWLPVGNVPDACLDGNTIPGLTTGGGDGDLCCITGDDVRDLFGPGVCTTGGVRNTGPGTPGEGDPELQGNLLRPCARSGDICPKDVDARGRGRNGIIPP
eukprot:gnl/TRDRNA2_/TRDRNA2_127625_c2_seq1.p2 gnl/TRDRNA2_/TRDRNA2_127625_c2~~gnl/TRDRNA2_/TRDRNA2_127625_c2_seq1.p2  ORF type:complete len:162 (+),score=20.63 gnl/TRDRNA2_/TRDRNA2_127625_c2_seq1:264-749(+)